ncbi:hypothetical protein [Janthinobacterium agaricidamnosum]|uniref:Secretion system X translation initiation factor n=1 Tax=Janthinobacterium agaricidamnosum NBRC 102515 = DSM 9628 TaxID=1349767 RepID=W0V3Z9_9BURK|nr:hypothetical protein [Janthinobacterium agaricidamnosum]CDG81977.1 hypothetical protein GJA_1324 [Janthinobacterium agaricidamnosum NBRC 102515 = DSM 9628]
MKIERRQGLALAALLTLVLVGWTAWRDVQRQDAAALPAHGAVRPGPAPASINADGAVGVADTPRDPLVEAGGDPFRVVTFLPPPPKLAPAPPPPPPAPVKPGAPPFPYQYFGRMVNIDGQLLTYLTRDNALIPIRAKETLDNTYRIDSISETLIVMTYLPLNEKVEIATRSAVN